MHSLAGIIIYNQDQINNNIDDMYLQSKYCRWKFYYTEEIDSKAQVHTPATWFIMIRITLIYIIYQYT